MSATSHGDNGSRNALKLETRWHSNVTLAPWEPSWLAHLDCQSRIPRRLYYQLRMQLILHRPALRLCAADAKSIHFENPSPRFSAIRLVLQPCITTFLFVAGRALSKTSLKHCLSIYQITPHGHVEPILHNTLKLAFVDLHRGVACAGRHSNSFLLVCTIVLEAEQPLLYHCRSSTRAPYMSQACGRSMNNAKLTDGSHVSD